MTRVYAFPGFFNYNKKRLSKQCTKTLLETLSILYNSASMTLSYFFQIFRITVAAIGEIYLNINININIKYISISPNYETVISELIYEKK